MALAWCATLAVLLLFPALAGRVAIAPEAVLDYDPLYRSRSDVPVPGGGDFTLPLMDLPRDLTVARAFQAGRLSKWNPLSACGAPLWAEQGGPFLPLKLPIYFVPSKTAYAVFLWLRLVVAGVGAWALARYRGLALAPALGAGALFELSGAMIELMPFGVFSPMFVLPWAVLGAEAVACTRRNIAILGAAVALALAAHAGHPTMAALVWFAYAADLGGQMLRRIREPRVAAVIAAAGVAAALLAMALAAPAWLPLAELAAQGRSYKYGPLGIEIWSMTVALSRATLPLALLTPHALQAMYTGIGPFFEGFASIGMIGLVLAVAGTIGGAPGLPLGCVALVGLAVAIQPAPASWVPSPLRAVSAYYAWPLVVLPLTQAAGYGIARLGDCVGVRRAVLALIATMMALGVLLYVGAPHRALSLPGLELSAMFSATLATGVGRIKVVAPAVAAIAVVAVCASLGRARRWVAPVAAVAAAAELLLLWWPVVRHPLANVSATRPSPAVTFLQQRLGDEWRFLGVPFMVGFPLTPMSFGLADVRGHSPLPIARYLHYMELVDPLGSLLTMQMSWNTRSPFLDLAAVRYVAVPRQEGVAPPPLLEDDPAVPLAYADAHVAIYENRAVHPRVRLVHRSQPVPDAAAARERLRALGAGQKHAGESLVDEVRLEPNAAGEPPPRLDEATRGGEWVRIVDGTDPDTVVIEGELATPGMVVLADTYYPGWTVTVDGDPAPIFPADLLFRAVAVPAGRHTLVFRYAPASFRWGVVLCGVGVAVCIALVRAHHRGLGGRSRNAERKHHPQGQR